MIDALKGIATFGLIAFVSFLLALGLLGFMNDAPIYFTPQHEDGMPPGWIVQQNENSGKFRWCSPMFYGMGVFYCSYDGKPTRTEAVSSAWEMYRWKEKQDSESKGWVTK